MPTYPVRLTVEERNLLTYDALIDADTPGDAERIGRARAEQGELDAPDEEALGRDFTTLTVTVGRPAPTPPESA